MGERGGAQPVRAARGHPAFRPGGQWEGAATCATEAERDSGDEGGGRGKGRAAGHASPPAASGAPPRATAPAGGSGGGGSARAARAPPPPLAGARAVPWWPGGDRHRRARFACGAGGRAVAPLPPEPEGAAGSRREVRCARRGARGQSGKRRAVLGAGRQLFPVRAAGFPRPSGCPVAGGLVLLGLFLLFRGAVPPRRRPRPRPAPTACPLAVSEINARFPKGLGLAWFFTRR